MRVGVLALQGGFRPHLSAVASLDHQAIEVRDARAFGSVEGLILCGGESTAQVKLIERAGLREPLLEAIGSMPVLATCAGMILLSHFGLLDVELQRNGYGPQIYSFEATSDLGRRPLVFIRAPRVIRVGPGVEVLDTLEEEPVLVRRSKLTAATFHPELTEDRTLYREVFGAPS